MDRLTNLFERRSDRLRDRQSAGRELAARLLTRPGLTDPVVLALPRGGVPVAAEIARALRAPLDLVLVRKIGAPFNPEYALAALVDGDPPDLVIDEPARVAARVPLADIEAEATREKCELARRRQAYLGGRSPVPVAGRTAIVVDDGIATGTTMRAALKALRRRGPARLVLAVPVAPADTLRELSEEVDEVVCLRQPEPFHAVGPHYVDFHQLEDREVLEALASVNAAPPRAADTR